MKGSKKYIPLYEKTQTDKVPLCERTDLTDKQPSKIFDADGLYAMARGSLSDSIWAKGNDANPCKSKRSTTPLNSGNHDESGPRKSSPAATYSNQQAASPHQHANTGDSTPYLPPHLRGIDQNGKPHLPPHLRAVCPNTQYNAPCQLSKSIETRNEPLRMGALQTPQRSKASGTTPVWHLSPESHAKQSPESYPSVGSMQANKSSPSVKKGVIDHEGKDPIVSPAPTSGSQEEAFLAFMNKKSEEDAKKRGLSKLAQQALTDPAPEPTLPSVSPITLQTPQIQPAVQVCENTHSSIENTDNFLAFLLKKEKEAPTSGKRYVAIGNSLQAEADGKETGGNHKGQNPATTHNTVKENNLLYTTPSRVNSGVPSNLATVTYNSMAIQSNMPIGDTGNYPDQRGFSVPRIGLGAVTSAATAGRCQEMATTGDLKADSFNSTTLKASHGWKDDRLIKAKNIHDALITEVLVYSPHNPDALPLTEESLIKKGGWAPRVRSKDSFCGKVSNLDLTTKKENVRASQGNPATDDLLLWNNVWRPPPQNWEADRYALNLDFMPKYIREDWEPFVPHGPPVTIDTGTKEFRLGKMPVNDNMLGEEVVQPDCMPDIANSENEQKRLRQTAEMDAMILTRRRRKRYRNAELHAVESEARHREIAALPLDPHPYAPAIPIYLRPAALTDAPGIRAIYNHYVKNSIIPEDQDEVLDEDITGIIKLCQQEKLPCIVAIKGNVPALPPQGHYGKSSKPPLPQFETVIGFGWAQTYGYGIGGIREGRSRTTAEVQFYAHHEYTRKGVGRSLLDRLVQSMSHSYAGKDGYDWINPKDDPTYNNGGPKLWHQLVLQLPVETKDDTTLPWLTTFLAKYWFDPEARLKRFARASTVRSKARFLDLVIFAKTSSIEMEHPSFI